MKAYAFIVNMVDHASSKLQGVARAAGMADDRMEGLNREANKSSNIFGRLWSWARNGFKSVAQFAGLAHNRVDRMNKESNRSSGIFGRLKSRARSSLLGIAKFAGMADGRTKGLNSEVNKSSSVFGRLGSWARNGFKSVARFAGLAHNRVDRMNKESNRSSGIFGRLKSRARSSLLGIAKFAGMADGRMEGLNREANKSSSIFGGLKGVLATVFTVVALTTFTNRVIDARAEYEKFQAVLTNTFQSSDVGEGALNMLTDFAAKTPFVLNELTGSFVKLVNRGFNPTMEQLTKMGDLATSQGKGFDQLTEAVLDAQTGKFERLKEFGIKASKAGDKITMSFKGITKEVDNNEASLRGVLLQYGEMVGVSGSMEAISKTLGGRISNLKDNWNTFLVAVGGEGNSVLTGFVDLASKGIAFLTDHLPQISKWFEVLWGFISPVVDSLKEFVKAAFGFNDAGDILESFGNVMSGVLLVVDWLTTGIMTVIDWLMPFADVIGVVTAAWALFNLMVAISPLGWVVIAILAIVAVIGMVTKYTDGWSTSWQSLSNVFKAIWASIKADFEFGVESFKFGFNLIILSAENAAQKIIGRFTKVSEAISMALDGNISGAWDKAFEKVDTRAEKEMEALAKQHQLDTEEWRKIKEESAKSIQNELGNIGISVDTEAASKDFQAIKDKFNGIGKAFGGTSAYDDYLAAGGVNASGSGKGKKGSKTGKAGGDTIVSGGTRKTNIYVTIQKLQDDTKIYVSSKEEGLKELGEKVQEVLLRSVNSINQMQTG